MAPTRATFGRDLGLHAQVALGDDVDLAGGQIGIDRDLPAPRELERGDEATATTPASWSVSGRAEKSCGTCRFRPASFDVRVEIHSAPRFDTAWLDEPEAQPTSPP